MRLMDDSRLIFQVEEEEDHVHWIEVDVFVSKGEDNGTDNSENHLENNVTIKMTLTSPGCPVAGEMPGWIQGEIFKVEGVGTVDVDLVFDPPWTPDMMAETAKLELNMF